MSEPNDNDGFMQRARDVGMDRAAYELQARQDAERQARIDELLAREKR